MFTLQVGELSAALIQMGMPVEMAQQFAQTFGDCAQTLQHNGPIDINGPVTIGAPGTTSQTTTTNNGGSSTVNGGTTVGGSLTVNGPTTITNPTQQTIDTFLEDIFNNSSKTVLSAFLANIFLFFPNATAQLAKWTGATVWLPGTNSSNSVEVFAGPAPESDQFRTVTALNRFHTILPGDFILIVKLANAWHVVGAFTDVLLGQYRDTSLAKGSTGTIHIVDDTFTDFTGGLTITGVRALQKLVNGDYVQLFWERVNTSHNYEWYAVKIPPGIAQDIDFHLAVALAHGDATATVAVDSYRNGIQASGTTTVNNTMGWSLPNAGHGWATLISYDPATGNAVYEIRAVRMTEWAGYTAGNRQILTHDTSGNTEWLDTAAQTVVTDMQNDTTAHLLQKKTRALTVIATAAESALTTIVGGTEDSC